MCVKVGPDPAGCPWDGLVWLHLCASYLCVCVCVCVGLARKGYDRFWLVGMCVQTPLRGSFHGHRPLHSCTTSQNSMVKCFYCKSVVDDMFGGGAVSIRRIVCIVSPCFSSPQQWCGYLQHVDIHLIRKGATFFGGGEKQFNVIFGTFGVGD